jgi:hypothetical protein
MSSVEISGADLLAFWGHEWPFNGGDVYLEEGPFGDLDDGTLMWWGSGTPEDVDSAEKILPNKTYLVKWGSLGWQGSGEPPSDWNPNLVSVLQKFLQREKADVYSIVRIPEKELEKFRKVCADNGWSIVY